MTQPVANIVNTVGTAGASTNVFITFFSTRAPTSNDTYFPVSKRWVDTSNGKEYILANLYVSNGTTFANWINLTNGTTSALDTLTGNSGGVITPDGSANINVLGDSTSINIVGSGHTLTANVILPSQYTTLASDGTSIHGVSPGSSGQVLVSNGASAFPTFQSVPSLTVPAQYDTVVSTGSALQGINPGITGQVLTSNGGAAYPTYQSMPRGFTFNAITITSSSDPIGINNLLFIGANSITISLPATTAGNYYFIQMLPTFSGFVIDGITTSGKIYIGSASSSTGIAAHCESTGLCDSILLITDGTNWYSVGSPQGIWTLS